MKRMNAKYLGLVLLAVVSVGCLPDPYYVADQRYENRRSPQSSISPRDQFYDTPSQDVSPDSYYEEQPLEPEFASPSRQTYPTAQRTNHPSRVLSPYPPHNVIDVEGFQSGQLGKDPSNGKIFRVP